MAAEADLTPHQAASFTLPWEDEAPAETLIDSLEPADVTSGSSKAVMVELRGFEPLTPSMRTRCATGLRYSPENLS